MSNFEDYNKKIEVIKAVPDDQIKVPHHIPVVTYIQESEHLFGWCKYDKEELTAKGLNWKVVEDLPVRCGALREAESKWLIQQSERRESAKILHREFSKGYNLRNELIHHFNYAFRDNSSLIKKVKKFVKGTTHADMIQSLNDLSVLGLFNRELLKKIGFDFTLLDLAAQKSDELSTKNGAASWDGKDYLEAKKIRNQAYTHLKEAVDYIREHGRYVFWKNPARLKGYRSDYRRMLNQRSTRRNRVPEPCPGNVPITNEL